MKICIVCAPGGHLTEMLKLNDAFAGHSVFLVTYAEKFINKPLNMDCVYFLKNVLVNNVQANRIQKAVLILLQMFFLTVHELKIFLKEKPDIVVSTGSEIAIPIFYIARIFGKKVIFIESLCRIDDLSGTGKIVRPISDLFFVQWESLSKKHKKNMYHGNILPKTQISFMDKTGYTDSSFILVTVGTAPFPRLVEIMDNISQKLNDRVIIQIGNTGYKPKNAEFFEFIDNFEDIRKLNREARIVVCHSGAGSIITALEENGNVIVFPRLTKFREHIDNHQLEIANVLEKQNLIKVAYNYDDLCNLILKSNEDNIKKSNDNPLEGPSLVDYLASVFQSNN